jgi:TPR repeat protein
MAAANYRSRGAILTPLKRKQQHAICSDLALVSQKDYAKAMYYFTLASNRGHVLALYNLAMMHLSGFGTPRCVIADNGRAHGQSKIGAIKHNTEACLSFIFFQTVCIHQ